MINLDGNILARLLRILFKYTTQKLHINYINKPNYCVSLSRYEKNNTYIEDNTMTLKELRKVHNMMRIECAKYLRVPLHTYQNYEGDDVKTDTIK